MKVYTCTTCGYKSYVYFPIEKTETIQKTATITFEANGGTPVAPITANVGSKIEEPTTTLLPLGSASSGIFKSYQK